MQTTKDFVGENYPDEQFTPLAETVEYLSPTQRLIMKWELSNNIGIDLHHLDKLADDNIDASQFQSEEFCRALVEFIAPRMSAFDWENMMEAIRSEALASFKVDL